MNYSPQHAAKALEIMVRGLQSVSAHAEYVELISVLQDPSRWKEAHEVFQQIRTNITLPAERGNRESKTTLDYYFIFIAENAAKTAYNCSGEPAPFDDASFDRLLKCEQRFAEKSSKKG